MRPGQQAPESLDRAGGMHVKALASMRPGQQAPESHMRGRPTSPTLITASMRPGQQAPESRQLIELIRYSLRRFNEARAASPGIPNRRGRLGLGLFRASMRPGQQAPESHEGDVRRFVLFRLLQ